MIRDQIVVSILHCWKNHSLIQTSHLSCNAGAPIRSHQTAAALTVGVEVCMGKPDRSHPTERGPGQRTNRRWSQATLQSQHVNTATPQRHPVSSPVCSRCGKLPIHDRENCPAKDATHQKCAKYGHHFIGMTFHSDTDHKGCHPPEMCQVRTPLYRDDISQWHRSQAFGTSVQHETPSVTANSSPAISSLNDEI